MKKLVILFLTLSMMLLPGACSGSQDKTGAKTDTAGTAPAVAVTTTADQTAAEAAADADNGVSVSETASAARTTEPAQESYDGAVVIALGDTITVSGSGASVQGSTVSVTAGGAYIVSGTLANGAIHVDTTARVELILNGADITNASGPAIYVANAKKLTLVLAEGTTNHLTDGASYADPEAKGALFSNDSLEIKGNGALVVTGNYKHGIASDDDVVISGGDITIAAVTDGVHANNNITVEGGSITITDAIDGLESEGDLLVSGGTLTISIDEDGIIGAGPVTIDGGVIDILSAMEGIESKSNIIVNDGQITLSASDDGLNAATDLTINGGTIYADVSRGDALDSNGSLNINGGVTVALGAAAPEGGSDTDQGAFSITGGIMLATGGSNSMPTSDSSTQCSVLLGSAPVDTLVRIELDGSEVITFRVTKDYQSMVLTTPSLQLNQTYTILTGGTVSGETEFHGLITGADYSGGNSEGTFTTSTTVTNAGGTSTTGGGPGGSREVGRP